MNELLKSTYHDMHELKEKAGSAIRRVQEHIKDNACAICSIPFSSDDPDAERVDTVLMKCCGIVLCSTCASMGLNFDSDRPQCANCRQQIKFGTHLIYINKDFNLEDINENKFFDASQNLAKEAVEEPDTGPESVEETVVPKIPENEKSKLDVVVDICRGIQANDQFTKIDINIPSLIEGINALPKATNDERRVVLFCNYEESIAKIKERLTEENIKVFELMGTPKQINQTVQDFKTQGTVLLVKAVKYASGLNLQFATDQIFFHRINDISIMSQVAGRCQRIGRTNELNIYVLYYESEKGGCITF
jgi:SNF2 family DNA or RNA helicase